MEKSCFKFENSCEENQWMYAGGAAFRIVPARSLATRRLLEALGETRNKNSAGGRSGW
jgi:hypothetical protein